jgi:hypothetical protein
MIDAPVTKPQSGPYRKPVTKAKVSDRPSLISNPNTRDGDTIASSSTPILTTVPSAINVETKVICLLEGFKVLVGRGSQAWMQRTAMGARRHHNRVT